MGSLRDSRGNASVATVVTMAVALAAMGGMVSMGRGMGTAIADGGKAPRASSHAMVVGSQAALTSVIDEAAEVAETLGRAHVAETARVGVPVSDGARVVLRDGAYVPAGTFPSATRTTMFERGLPGSRRTTRTPRVTAEPSFTVGLDLDGVVGKPTLSWFRSNLRGIAASFLRSGIGSPRTKLSRMHDLAANRGIYRNMGVVRGAPASLRSIAEAGADIHVITARPASGSVRVATDTTFWLDRHGIPHDQMSFTSKKTTVRADVYVDDSPKNIKAYQEAGRLVIIFDRPYNRHISGLRAKNWGEVEQLIAQIREGKIKAPQLN